MTRFRLESGLGLVGAFAGIAAFGYAFYSAYVYFFVYSIGGFSILAALALLLVSFILAFVGAAMLRNIRRSGGVLILLAGAMTAVAVILSFPVAWAGIVSSPFLLLSGILSIAKRFPKDSELGETYINTFDGLR